MRWPISSIAMVISVLCHDLTAAASGAASALNAGPVLSVSADDGQPLHAQFDLASADAAQIKQVIDQPGFQLDVSVDHGHVIAHFISWAAHVAAAVRASRLRGRSRGRLRATIALEALAARGASPSARSSARAGRLI